MTTTKISALFMILAITLSIAGFTYAHWADTIQITGTVKMAHIKMTIISYKNLTSQEVKQYSNITSQLSADNHTLTLACDGLKPCWFIWIGLKTQNTGSLPANVKSIQYSFNDSDGFNYFNITEYFYGPFEEAEGPPEKPIHKVWGDVKVGEKLFQNGTVNFDIGSEYIQKPSFTVEPGEKVIIWIWIHCKAGEPGKTVTLYINILDDIAI